MMAHGSVFWLRYVSWSPLLFAFVFAGIPTLALYTNGTAPRQRLVSRLNATLSNPILQTSIPAVSFLIPSFLLALAQICVAEFLLMRYVLSLGHRAANAAQAVVYLLSSFAYSVLFQQAASLAVRCLPKSAEVQ
jgi:hypothetical protein